MQLTFRNVKNNEYLRIYLCMNVSYESQITDLNLEFLASIWYAFKVHPLISRFNQEN